MTDSTSPTNDAETQDVVEETILEPVVQDTEPEIDPRDVAYAQTFRVPTSLETSLDGNWMVWLQPNEAGVLELWLSATSDGSTPTRLDLPFTPVEDRDPETGRLLRGPQFSPDSSSIAVTGLHPDGDRTAIWIVSLGIDPQPVQVTESSSDDAATEPVVDDSADVEVDAEKEVDSEAIETSEETETPAVEAEAASESEGDIIAAAAEPVAEEVAEAESEVALGEMQSVLLADHAGADRSPRWSPDGEIIAFTSTIDGRDVIALGSPSEPGGLEMLTWSRSDSREPQWSRDGKFLAFLRPIDGGEEFHDIWSFSLEAGVLTNLTGEKSPAVRHSIEWVPGRNLVAFVTVENDWLGISVVNADNKAGWIVTRESGDKTEPRFANNEARLLYVRTEGFTTVLCERSLHSSASVALDPGEGVASMGRWCGIKQVAYGFSAPQQPFNLMVQESVAKAERTTIAPEIGGSIRGMELVQPQPLEFKVGPDETFSGLLYQPEAGAGKHAAAVYLPEGPLATRRGAFQAEEQALASAGLTVLSPVLHGAAGFGEAIENDLREFADTELEITDIAEAARALGKEGSVDPAQVALVGHGYGGALALSAAGARPGSFAAVVAIDPIFDWTIELANANLQWRGWVTDRYGMPLTHADVYALRSPATFSAVIDVPTILVRTAGASESRRVQFDLLTQDLDEVGVAYTVIDAPAEPLSATLRRVGKVVSDLFTPHVESGEAPDDLNVDET